MVTVTLKFPLLHDANSINPSRTRFFFSYFIIILMCLFALWSRNTIIVKFVFLLHSVATNNYEMQL